MRRTSRQRGLLARERQRRRFSKKGSLDIVCNADMRVGEIRQYCRLPEEVQSLIRAAMAKLFCGRGHTTAREASNSRVRFQIWQGVKRSGLCIGLSPCNSVLNVY